MHKVKKQVAIIGAGLAGCSVAYELSKSNDFETSIFDENSSVASMTSGNYAGIASPNLTIDNNLSDQFHTLGYQVLLEFINDYRHKLDICSNGVIQPLSKTQDIARYSNMFQKRQFSKDIAILLDNTDVKKVTNQLPNTICSILPKCLVISTKNLM